MDVTSLVWTPVHSQATWTGQPSAPRVVRAALTGQGWLVATEVATGWSVAFVPDQDASPPSDESMGASFHAAKVGWDQREVAPVDRKAASEEQHPVPKAAHRSPGHPRKKKE